MQSTLGHPARTPAPSSHACATLQTSRTGALCAAVCVEVGSQYDSGMTAAKIAITLPREQLLKAKQAVKSGEASSVSGYIASALAEKEQRESLRALVDELKRDHGEPNKREIAWAKRALSRRRQK